MRSDLTWLHLSDLHLCPERTGWDAERILHALGRDLDGLRREQGLAPDLLFFTGDAAFGELPDSPIAEQFEDVRRFFDEIRGLCDLPPERLFLVPGNHDVHRGEITPFETDGLAKMNHDEVVEMLRRGDKTWRRVMERLADYRAFLETAGYTHLLDDRERLVYARRLTVRGLDVGIAGLNSAWSCHGEDKGQLWLGGEWQLATAEAVIRDAAVRIGLIHHPLRWFCSGEAEEDLEPHFARLFDFHLHGHEHKPWVHPLDGGTVRIAAGACYDRKRKERPAGYNLVRLDLSARRGEVWLRQYQDDTAQWIPYHVAGKTDAGRPGVWRLDGLRCLSALPEPEEPEEPPGEEETGPGDAAQDAAVLAAWRHHVERANANLTAAFDRPGAPQLLDHVYVELRMVEREGLRLAGEAPDAAPDLALGLAAHLARAREPLPGRAGKLAGRLALEEVLALDPADFGPDRITGRWLLYGDPGSGKTTLLRHLAWRLARTGGDARVPVFVPLPRIVRAGAWFLDALCEEHKLTSVAPAGLCDALDRLGREGRLLLLFDGLDEVPSDLRAAADALVGESADRWPRTPIVVTSRPIGGHRPGPEFRELELLPFEDAERRAFLARWLGDAARADAALARLRREATVWELAGNPLYLTLLAMLFEEKVEIPERRSALYDRIFGHLLSGKHRREHRAIQRPLLVRAILRHLAEAMTEDDREAESAEALEERLWEAEAVKARLDKVERWRENPRAFLVDVAEKTSLLAPHDGPGADWRYWHRTFREALAAEALYEELRRDGEKALLERARSIEGDLGRWAEPYALLVGQIDVPDALVETLMETNRPLGLRALATAQGLAEETVDKVLGLTSKWEERRDVFRRIPELLDDADAALRLIDRLRRRTSEGNDLFFLDAAAVEVGERWPESAGRVADLRGRLFDHLASPPPEMFSTVETVRDGRVELWREIPAGTFRMGSPESEPEFDGDEHPLGAFSSERPQHEVRISSPFEMAVVPVTNAQYRAFDPTHEPHLWEGVSDAELADHPVVNVTWYAAVTFCRWLSIHHPGVRLSMEEEWEYACRAGTTTRFWCGDDEDDLESVGWYGRNSGGRTYQVGEKPPNAWGLYDVHGNVWEWTQSPWTGDYSEHESGRTVDPSAVPAASPADLAGEATPGGWRVFRGGCYWLVASGARSAFRGVGVPWDRFLYLGFRLVRPVRRPER